MSLLAGVVIHCVLCQTMDLGKAEKILMFHISLNILALVHTLSVNHFRFSPRAWKEIAIKLHKNKTDHTQFL